MGINEFFVSILFVATCLMLFISYLCFRKSHLTLAKYTAFVMLAASFYSFGYAFEMLSTDLESIKFWLRVEYIGIPFISTLWLILVLNYTGYQNRLKKWVFLFLFTIPVMTCFLHFTNDFHHFFYYNIKIADGSLSLFSKVQLIKGPWYWVHITYNYLQATVGMLLFFKMYLDAKPIVRKQIFVMMLGALAPWLTNIIYLLSDLGSQIDLTPVGFAITGVFYLWGIYRFNLNRLVPIAMERVFETMQDGVIILDYENKVMNINQAAREMFGNINRITKNNDRASYVFSNYPELLSKINSTKSSDSFSVKTGKDHRYYQMKISNIYERGQLIIGKIIIFHDITEITLTQEKLLANANQLAELSAFKDKLFTVVAHDIRDPLAVLVNLTDLLEEELEDKKKEELSIFHEVSEQVKNTFMLVENLLDWYRSQQGKIIFNPLDWNLTLIINQAVATMKYRIEIKKIKVTHSIDGDIRIFADKEMVDLIIRNLISNAVKFTELGGKIEIGAHKNKENVTIFIKDSDIGIDEKTSKTLFLEMQHVPSTGTNGEKGTGFGLYLANKFVQINGGEIWCESILGKGTTFFITFPTSKKRSMDVRGVKTV